MGVGEKDGRKDGRRHLARLFFAHSTHARTHTRSHNTRNPRNSTKQKQANSGDTKGIVGPRTTWREVQWTKIRLLSRLFGLRPWYCKSVDAEFCETVEWD